ncbi:MAG: glutamyl-tRNA reductase [Bacteroidota bacterium]
MIGVIGLSHKSAPLDVRECYAFGNHDVTQLSQKILTSDQVDEVVIISTCNRTELYFVTSSNCLKGAIKHIDHCLRDYGPYDPTSKKHFYHLFDNAAVNHLFRLISGLESMVTGEYQIVSQVKEAYDLAHQNNFSGKILNRLFIKTLEVGKLVRTRTEISRGAFSVSYAAVEKCRTHFSNLEERNILLVGAGETGELVVKNFHKRGCHRISIANRTAGHAEELAGRYQAETVPFTQLADAIRKAEIVISSVSGEHLIHSQMLGGSPFEHKVMMVDLGVPRNIHPRVGEMDHVRLLNIDDLQKVVLQNEEKKKSYFDIAEQIIAEKSEEFNEWLISQKLSPTIQNIVKSVRQMHAEGLEAYRASLSDEEFEALERYGQHLSEKMIKTVVKNLRETSENGRKSEVVKAVGKLFE